MTGKAYLKKEGFANIELFTNKGPFERLELISNTLEKYHKSEVKKLNISSISQRIELLKALADSIEKEFEAYAYLPELIEHIKAFNCA